MNLDDMVRLVSVHKGAGMTDAQVIAELTVLFDGRGFDVAKAVEVFHEQALRIRTLQDPPTVVDPSELADSWYLGPRPGDRFWWPLNDVLRAGLPGSAVDAIDRASTKVFALWPR